MNYPRKINFYAVLTLLFLFVGMTSCLEDEGGDSYIIVGDGRGLDVGVATKSYPGVDERLWIYFENFEKEGQARGVNVDLIAAEMTGVIEKIENGSAAGSCTTDAMNSFHHIIMDSDFWATANVTNKELILFHELGHCYLNRDHYNEAFSDGVCKSLMREGHGECKDNYNSETREYYLDELFGGN